MSLMDASPYAARPMAMVGRKHDAIRMAARDVDDFDWARDLAAKMRATLVRQDGAGLAACQVGVPVNLVVTSAEHGGRALANIRLSNLDGKLVTLPEGCLTLPGRWFEVPRHTKVDVTAHDLATDEEVTFSASDSFQARLWQHENDHLQGVLLIGRHPEIRRR